MTFYSVGRLDEFTVHAIKSFDPAKHITRVHISEAQDQQGLPVTIFHIPCMKASPLTGEDAFWSEQDGLSDPKAALTNHFSINDPAPSAHLFTWKHPNGPQPLSKKELMAHVLSISLSVNLPNLKGHSLHIRGTLMYLLRGIPFDVVKSMGHWSSKAFTIYLHQHAIILAPYIQATPILEPFTRYTMPLVC